MIYALTSLLDTLFKNSVGDGTWIMRWTKTKHFVSSALIRIKSVVTEGTRYSAVIKL